MATTHTSSSGSSVTEVLVQRVRTKYHWPPVQLNVWFLIMLVGSATVLGIFAQFLVIQNTLLVGIPWYFSYWIAVSALTIIFIFILLGLIQQRQLLPGIVIIGSFILLVLWTVGLIVVSIQLWGPRGSVNGNCQLYVESRPVRGQNSDTLAWLQQRSICQQWTAAWAFQLVGAVFLLWMMIMAYQVYRDD